MVKKNNLNFFLGLVAILCGVVAVYYFADKKQVTEFFVDRMGDVGESVGEDDVVAFGIFFSKETGEPYSKMGYNALKMGDLGKPLQSLLRKIGVGGRGRFISPYDEYIPDGADSKFPKGQPVRAEVEFLFKIPFNKVVETRRPEMDVGLLVVDADGAGEISTLGNRPWQKKESDFMNVDNCRKFAMDGVIGRFWEWIVPTTSFVLYAPGGRAPSKVTGEHLIGTVTGLHKWNSAYDVLSQLDSDDDELVSGEELKDLFLWVDKNIDGQAQTDELLPASSKLQSLAVGFSEDDIGGRSNKQGVTLLDGKKTGTWEFRSRGEVISKERESSVGGRSL